MPGPRYVTGVFEGVFAVRWRIFTLPALAELREEVSQTRRNAGRRVVYLSLIPPSPHDFTDGERNVLASFVRDLLVHDCASIHHVIGGAGFTASARRSIVTGLALVVARPDAFHTHSSLEAALAGIAEETGVSADVLLADATSHDIPFPAKRDEGR